mmetsp:Transcript_15063/g.32905  ORF Transcript_15063/g.32905 Transcript_15063/m.32905 type:complete len:411 (+) Transcript_15063:280-1512(+)
MITRLSTSQQHQRRLLVLLCCSASYLNLGLLVHADTAFTTKSSPHSCHQPPCHGIQEQQRQRQQHYRQQQQQSKNPSPPPFWGSTTSRTLPLLPKQQHQRQHDAKDFMEECESFLATLERLRGGYFSDYNGGGGEYNDDPDGDDYYYNEYNNNNDNSRGYNDNADDDGYYYDDRGRSNDNQSSSRRRRHGQGDNAASTFVDSLPGVFQRGDRRIGLPLTAAGATITLLGMSLFFNKTLLRLGNLLFITGVAATLGLSRVVSYFFQPQKIRATACLGLGIVLVFLGSPVLGMILQVFGLLNLFGNMFPMLLAIAKTLPGIGPLLSQNNIKKKNNNNNSSNSGGRRRNDYDDPYNDNNNYYNDDRGYDDDDGYGRQGGNDNYYDDGSNRYNEDSNYDGGQRGGYGRDDDGYY